MSLESVRDEFKRRQIELEIIELSSSTATVALAAQAHGVEPGRIAKTLAFRLGDERVVLLVARGDARIDNRKFKAALGKGKMLGAHEVETLTGHPVGGVCPFGLALPLPVYLDVSLRDFDTVMPAAGGTHTAVRIAPERLRDIVAGEWVNVCQPPTPPTD
ncbi:YbaK/EbsC family protein [Paludibacterium purpuratum]|uniref:Prolyl-tRNA editing enzyme YbaK/EbsC (Cys-tRNA(Pro) deacylase) n=1 Tax=Paludibacterium purpuratum TaxID=1144873 RepID=A0A4R7BDR4_9NEIS|nr:YbaK/EbsC family protein [Paludibacterium purpuratum]TDR82893.1 prolyl-tRNA editing enzyme YbaK/EbsC (Cys-tRNA(Pro) deacylase) [Paludibacterium purpuratum]